MKQQIFPAGESCLFITGKRKIDVSGCLGVKLCTREKIILSQCDGETEITGDGLVITVFSGKEIRISGNIGSVSLIPTKNERRKL